MRLSCLGKFGGPVQRNLVVGNLNGTEQYHTARGLLITILVNGNDDPALTESARDWEQTYINFLRGVQNDYFRISFIAQRSIQVSFRGFLNLNSLCFRMKLIENPSRICSQ